MLSGLFLVLYYSNDRTLAFSSVQYIIYEVSEGWLMRILHFNGASFFFVFLYLHFFKALIFFRYRLKWVWGIGIVIFLIFIIIAFIGYVLVWAQIRFWACVVITSLLTVIPYFGFNIVFWIWGGFSVTGVTLKFFFVLHFLLPWLSWILVFFHLFFLHNTGSTSSLYCFLDLDKVNFFPYFIFKDLLNIAVFILFFILCMFYPFFLGDSEIFLEANILISPVHIVPEWYFTPFYAILRACPNKLGGVISMLAAILCLFLLPFFETNYRAIAPIRSPIYKILFWLFISNYTLINIDLFNIYIVFRLIICSILLSWLGQCVIEFPFIIVRSVISFFYFFIIFFIIFNILISALFL